MRSITCSVLPGHTHRPGGQIYPFITKDRLFGSFLLLNGGDRITLSPAYYALYFCTVASQRQASWPNNPQCLCLSLRVFGTGKRERERESERDVFLGWLTWLICFQPSSHKEGRGLRRASVALVPIVVKQSHMTGVMFQTLVTVQL